MYKLTQSPNTVHRLSDNAFIPFDGSTSNVLFIYGYTIVASAEY